MPNKMKETKETKPKNNVGYNRVAIKRGPHTDKPILSFPVSYRDKFMCFLTGESEDTRAARSRLGAYLKLLELEYQVRKERTVGKEYMLFSNQPASLPRCSSCVPKYYRGGIIH